MRKKVGKAEREDIVDIVLLFIAISIVGLGVYASVHLLGLRHP